jgi:predicted TIM-barrel fold metal-dependent hydrolase
VEPIETYGHFTPDFAPSLTGKMGTRPLPSDFFRQNVFCSFQEDVMGVRDRAIIGVENLMWGSDYPHQESTWPKSREILDQILADVPEDEKVLIAGENVARLYQF